MTQKEKLIQLKEEVKFISYPHYFTDKGNRYNINETEGDVAVHSQVQMQENGHVKVLSRTINSDCINGVCPVK